jgi:hypothetical protein
VTRAILVAAVALCACTLLPSASAHQGHIDHVNPHFSHLEPGGTNTDTLVPNEGTLEKGWEFLVVAIAQNGTATLTLTAPSGATEREWSVAPGAVAQLNTALKESGNYTLTVADRGAGPIDVAYYFDQSCNCVGKPIPVEIPQGMVIFNIDPPKGKLVDALYPEPPAMRFKVTAAMRTGERGVWPDDFKVLTSSETPNVATDPKAPPARLHELTFTSDGTRAYFFVEATSVDRAKVASGDDVLVVPTYTLKDPVKAPAASVAAVLALLALAAFWGPLTRPR